MYLTYFEDTDTQLQITAEDVKSFNERPTGYNMPNWMRRLWGFKTKAIWILILTEIFPSVFETWYLKHL